MDLLQRVSNLIKQQPETVALLFRRHGMNADPTKRNVANAIKIKPDFFSELIKAAGGSSLSNLTGDDTANRITFADKLANAGLVFSNIIRDTQRQPEPYNRATPDYYERTGSYTAIPARNIFQQSSTRFMGVDKRLLWGAAIVLALVIFFEMRGK